MAYCVAADVKDWIPATYDSTTRMPDADITTLITKADGYIDAAAAQAGYNRFNATTATPATPEMVHLASRHLSTAFALEQINVNDNFRERIERHKQQAEEYIALLTSEYGLKPETKTNETLTFGSASREDWELDENQAFLAATSPLDSGDVPNIAAQTVSVYSATGITNPSQLRNGIDFRVWYDQHWQKWVFERLTSDLQDAATVAVSYLWDYRRVRGHSRRTATVVRHG